MSGPSSILRQWLDKLSTLPEDHENYWRERLLFALMTLGLLAGLVILVPSVTFLVRRGSLALAAVDTGVFLVLLFITLSRRVSFNIRAWFVSLVLYGLGSVLLIGLGPYSGGPVWLMAFPLIAGVLLGMRVAVVALGLNVLIMAAVGVLLVLEVPLPWIVKENPDWLRWVVYGGNVLFIDAVATMGLTLLMHNLTVSNQRQSETLADLRRQMELRREALERLEASESRLGKIVRESQAGYFFIDRQGIFREVNQAWLTLHGFSDRSQVIGQHFSITQVDQDRQSAEAMVSQLLRSETVPPGVFSRRNQDGSVGYHSFSVNPVRRDGEVVGLEGFLIDVTEKTHYEQALSQSEAKYRSLYNSMSELSALHELVRDADGQVVDYRVIDCNEAFSQVTGLNRQRALGALASELYASTPPPYLEVYARTAQSGQPQSFDTYYAPMGKHFRISVFSPGPDTFATIASDITEIKEAQRDQVSNLLRQRLAMDLAGLVHWEYDVDADLFTFNDQFYALYATTAAEQGGYRMLSGEYARRFLHPDDAVMVGQEVAKAIAASDPGYLRQVEHRIIRADGRERLISVRLAVVKDESGRTIRTYGANQDITELRRAERQVAELAAIVASSQESIISLDLSGVITSWNQGATNLYGFSAAEALGQHASMLIPPEIREQSADYARRFLEGRESGQFETQRLTKDGRLLDMAIILSLIKDDTGRLVGISGIARDITERKRAQEALRQSEETFRLAFQTSPEAVGITRVRDGLYVDVNQGFVDISGYSREELMGKTSLEINIWANPGDRQRLVEGLAAHGKVTNLEADFLLKDGRAVPALMSAAVFELNGEPHIYSTTKVIEQQKKAEEALRRSEERYRLLVESAKEGIVVAQDGMIKFHNSRMLELTGLTADEYMASPFINHVHVEDRARVMARHEQRMQGDTSPNTEAFRIVDKQGQIKWLLPNGVQIDWEGQPATLAFFTDITQRKQAELELREAKERLEMAQTYSRAGSWDWNLASGEIQWSHHMFALFGLDLSTHKASVEAWRSIVHPDDLPLAQEAVNNALRQHTVLNCDFRVILPQGDIRWLNAVGRGEYDAQGKAVRVLGICLDITDRKLAALEREQLELQLRQAQKMEALGTLAGGIAHDFNNILGAVMGFAEMAYEDSQTGKVSPNDLQQILISATRAKELVQQILTFSRKKGLDLRPLDLNQAVERASAILERTLPKMITITTALAPGLPAIQADATQIEQVLLNLAANAKDAMPEGGRLTISTRLVSMDESGRGWHLELLPGDYILLEVNDTGLGIRPADLEHIFEPFFTTKGIGRGTGLGLSTTYGIVKSHGGYIYCQSHPGQGTVFEIYLPIPQQQDPATGELETAQGAQALAGSETILLVDDEASLRTLGARTLGSKGYQVISAENGEMALEVYSQRQPRPDLVIMDLGMPGMGGLKALQAILEQDPGAKVLIASGYASNEQINQALQAGAAGYVLKPFRQAELLGTVRRVLDGA